MNLNCLVAVPSLLLVLTLAPATYATTSTFIEVIAVVPWPNAALADSELESLELVFDVPTSAVGSASLTLDVIGDFNDNNEFLEVYAESFSLGRLFDSNAANDLFDLTGDTPGQGILAAPGVSTTATIPLASLSGVIADGQFILTLVPTQAHQPARGVPASLEATLSFEAVPEPSSTGLVATAIGLIVVASRRRLRGRE